LKGHLHFLAKMKINFNEFFVFLDFLATFLSKICWNTRNIVLFSYFFCSYSRSALRTVTFSDVEQSLEEKELLSSSSISAVTSTSTTEYLSAISSDDEEFYDLPTDDNESGNRTPTNDNINTSSNNLVTKALERLENELLVDQDVKDMRLFYHAVDELMEGSAEQQKQAFDLLKSRKSKVHIFCKGCL